MLALCWNHIRRCFHEIAKSGNAPIASEALTRLGEFYAIEDDVPGSRT